MPDITITVGNATWTKSLTGPEAQEVLANVLAVKPNSEIEPGSEVTNPPGTPVYTDAEWVLELLKRSLKKLNKRGKRIRTQQDGDELDE